MLLSSTIIYYQPAFVPDSYVCSLVMMRMFSCAVLRRLPHKAAFYTLLRGLPYEEGLLCSAIYAPRRMYFRGVLEQP